DFPAATKYQDIGELLHQLTRLAHATRPVNGDRSLDEVVTTNNQSHSKAEDAPEPNSTLRTLQKHIEGSVDHKCQPVKQRPKLHARKPCPPDHLIPQKIHE